MTNLDRRLAELNSRPILENVRRLAPLKTLAWRLRWWLFGLACGAFWLGVFVLIEAFE